MPSTIRKYNIDFQRHGKNLFCKIVQTAVLGGGQDTPAGVS